MMTIFWLIDHLYCRHFWQCTGKIMRTLKTQHIQYKYIKNVNDHKTYINDIKHSNVKLCKIVVYVLQTKYESKNSQASTMHQNQKVYISRLLWFRYVWTTTKAPTRHKHVKAAMAPWRQRLRYTYIAISWVSYGIWIAYQKMSKQILQTIS